MKPLTVLLLLLAGPPLAAAGDPAVPGSPPPARPRWHHIVTVPPTNAPAVHFWNKLNPIWWAENASEPHAPAWYRPNGSWRNVWWWFRNPFSNFSSYVIGVADKPTVRYGRYPDKIGNPNGGWNFAVTRRRIVLLPFLDYKRGRFEFYFGWRQAGDFGIKLNFRQKNPGPANLKTGGGAGGPRLFIWDQPVDPGSGPGADDGPGLLEASPVLGELPPGNADGPAWPLFD